MHVWKLAWGLLGLGFGLMGCAQGLSFMHGLVPTPSPSIWWETHVASISYLSGPATAGVGQPTTLTARVVIGSSSCDRYKDLVATVDAASHSVVLHGVRESLRADQPYPCTDDYGAKLATISVTFPSTGSYRVVADPFEGAAFAPDETPRGTIDIEVIDPS